MSSSTSCIYSQSLSMWTPSVFPYIKWYPSIPLPLTTPIILNFSVPHPTCWLCIQSSHVALWIRYEEVTLKASHWTLFHCVVALTYWGIFLIEASSSLVILSCINLAQNSHQADIFFVASSMYTFGNWAYRSSVLGGCDKSPIAPMVGILCTGKTYKSHMTRKYLFVVTHWEWQGISHTHGNFTIFLCICSCVWVYMQIHVYACGSRIWH